MSNLIAISTDISIKFIMNSIPGGVTAGDTISSSHLCPIAHVFAGGNNILHSENFNLHLGILKNLHLFYSFL